MAWGRKKSGGRKEPQFGLAAALSELRLNPQDRIPFADDKPKKSAKPSTRRPTEDADDEPPRERKPQASRSKRRAKSRGGFSLSRLVYWGAVLGLWGAIA